MAGQGREGKMALEELEVGESSSFTMRLGDGDSMVATNSSGGGISRMETGDGDRGGTVAVGPSLDRGGMMEGDWEMDSLEVEVGEREGTLPQSWTALYVLTRTDGMGKPSCKYIRNQVVRAAA
jgi:hypothetical protein